MKKRKKPEVNDVVKLLQRKWPSGIVARAKVEELTGGLVSPKTLANEDSRGCGIPRRLKVRGRIAYRVEDVAQYLIDRGLVLEGWK